jgi:hypothetical protein
VPIVGSIPTSPAVLIMIILKMKQIAKNRWQILAPNGSIMADYIHLYSLREAEEYVKAYVSGNSSWTYVLEE